MSKAITTKEIVSMAFIYVNNGFQNPNEDYKITDTIQAQSTSKEELFWDIIDIAKMAQGKTN
jgi:hypothetical protein